MVHNGEPHIVCSLLSEKETSRSPRLLCGVLSKESPSRLPFPISKERLVILQDGVLYWFPMGSAAPADCKGCVNFCENPFCEVRKDPNSRTRFMLTPADGQWRRGNFTGASSGRIFVFDAMTDSPSREFWLKAFRKHIAYGNGQFEGNLMPAPQAQQGRGNGKLARILEDAAEEAPPDWGTRALGQLRQADHNADSALATPTMVADQKHEVVVTLSDMSKNTVDVMRQPGLSVEHIVKAYVPAKQQQLRDYLQPEASVDEDQDGVSTCQPAQGRRFALWGPPCHMDISI